MDKSSGDSNSLILSNISPSSFPGSLNLIWLTPTILLLFKSRTVAALGFLNSIFPVGIKISEAVILPLAVILPEAVISLNCTLSVISTPVATADIVPLVSKERSIPVWPVVSDTANIAVTSTWSEEDIKPGLAKVWNSPDDSFCTTIFVKASAVDELANNKPLEVIFPEEVTAANKGLSDVCSPKSTTDWATPLIVNCASPWAGELRTDSEIIPCNKLEVEAKDNSPVAWS